MGTKSYEVTTGWKYLFGIHMGFGRGPVDEVVEIRVADESAWTGSVTESATITIDKPNLFGGDDGEGGIVGDLDVMMGESDQPANTRLANMLGGLVSAFRGQFTAFFDGQVCSNSPYPKKWAIRMRRAVRGWYNDEVWYPEKAIINLTKTIAEDDETDPALLSIRAMNAIHMLVQLNTDPDCRNIPWERLDLDSYVSAANTLYDEGFGVCFRWNRTTGVAALVGRVIDHIGGAQFVSRRTGLLTVKLIRDDYEIEDLPLFTTSTGLLGIDDGSTTTDDVAYNEVIVTYHDPVENEDRQVRERNRGAIAAAGETISVSTDYEMIPTAELAHRVAARDVRAYTSGTQTFDVRLDRRGYDIDPADVIRISSPEDGIEHLVLRVVEADYGTLTAGTCTFKCTLDVYGLPAAGWSKSQATRPNSNDRVPGATEKARLDEATYRDSYLVAQANTLTMQPGLILCADLPQNLSRGYRIMARNTTLGDYQKRSTGVFTPNAVLATPIPRMATSVYLTDYSLDFVDLFETGEPALLNDEIVRVDGLQAVSGVRVLTIFADGLTMAEAARILTSLAYVSVASGHSVTLFALQDSGGTEGGGVDWGFPGVTSSATTGTVAGTIPVAGGNSATTASAIVNNNPWATATAQNSTVLSGTAAPLFSDAVVGVGGTEDADGDAIVALVFVITEVDDSDQLTASLTTGYDSEGEPVLTTAFIPLAAAEETFLISQYRYRVVDVRSIATLARGCIDTLPARHEADSTLWCSSRYHGYWRNSYGTTGTVYAKPLTRTGGGILDEDDAPVVGLALRGNREIRPYLPGAIQVNDIDYPYIAEHASEYTVTFAHRDRELQADLVVDCTEGDTGHEEHVIYKVRLTDIETGLVAYENLSLLVDTDSTLPYVNSSTGNEHRLEVWSRRYYTDSVGARQYYDSWQRYAAILPPGTVPSAGLTVTFNVEFLGGSAGKSSLMGAYPQNGSAVALQAHEDLLGAIGRTGISGAGTSATFSSVVSAGLPVLSGSIGSALVWNEGAALDGWRALNITMLGDDASITGLMVAFEGELGLDAGALNIQFEQDGSTVSATLTDRTYVSSIRGVTGGATLYIVDDLEDSVAGQLEAMTIPGGAVTVTVAGS